MKASIAIVALAALYTSTTLAAHVTFTNKHRYYFDVNGNAIDTYNGKVQWINNQYFWIGEPKSCEKETCDKVSYSSRDLVNWVYNGPLFNISTPVNTKACIGFGSCSRPKVIYNSKTKKYVFYGFAAPVGGKGVPVFTSDHLTHGYKYVGNMMQAYSPPGYGLEDLGLAVIDGKGYLIYSGFNITHITYFGTPSSIWPPFVITILVEELTEDFLNGTGKSYPVIEEGGDFPVTSNSPNLADGGAQAPDLIKRGDTYYVIGSGTCGFCAGTTTLAYRSRSPFGPWKRQTVDSDSTCGGQAMGVATIPSPTKQGQNAYVYQADMFNTAPVGQDGIASKGHSFWTLDFQSDGSIGKIDCSPDATFTVDAPTGDSSIPTTGRATNATDGSGNYGHYWSETGIAKLVFLYQTWSSSKSGNLTEVGINLAANAPNEDVGVTVFRYQNESQFLSPYFNWETLASVTLGLNGTISSAFKVVRVAVNKKVNKGDRLGIALTSGTPRSSTGALPYAYLVQDISDKKNDDHVLYSLTRGHVSFSGRNGNESPIQNVKNREIKWYALVE